MYKFISTTTFSILIAISWFFVLLTALPIFVQFVLIPDVNRRIWDVVVGGFPYLIVGAAFFTLTIQRRYTLFYRLSRIPRHSILLREDEVPYDIYSLIQMEYHRVSAIAHMSRPTNGFQPGWGRPGTIWEGIYFKRTFLDAVERLDATAREILPSLPPLNPNALLSTHFQPLMLIMPISSNALKDADAVMQIAIFAVDEELEEPFSSGEILDKTLILEEKRLKNGEMTEDEFVHGMRALDELQAVLDKEKEFLGSELSSLSGRLPGSIPNSVRGSRIHLHADDIGYEDEEYTDALEEQGESLRKRAYSGFYRHGPSEKHGGRMDVQEPFTG